MKREELEQVVEKALAFLGQILPGSVSLYFPLLSVAFTWAIRSSLAWEEEIFAWQIWPDPEWLQTKSDDFILDFFSGTPKLHSFFRNEIESRNLIVLRPAFLRLYPVLGLEDPFLCGLFYPELKQGDFAALLTEFDARVETAKADIESLPERSRLLEGLRTIAEEAASLGIEVLSQKEIQELILSVIERENPDEND